MTFQTTGIPKTPRRPDERPPRERRLANPRRTVVAAAIAVIVAVAWTHGTFDNFLWRVHLNYTTCGQNAFGATFCGDQLKQYQERLGQNP
jgi:hypothetical protein